MSDFGSVATAQMVVHDALCPANDYENLSPSLQAWKPDCQCDLLAKARADERTQAGARVAGLVHWEDGWPENVVVNRASAIYAAESVDDE